MRDAKICLDICSLLVATVACDPKHAAKAGQVPKFHVGFSWLIMVFPLRMAVMRGTYSFSKPQGSCPLDMLRSFVD